MARNEPVALDRLILRIAAGVEEQFTDEHGVIDKHGLTTYVRDNFEEDYPDAVDYYHDETGWKYIWELIRKNFRDTRNDLNEPEDEDGQFRLIPLKELEKYRFSVPVGVNQFETKRFSMCSVEEARAIGRDYIQRSRRMAQIGRWVLAHADEAERRGLEETSLIRDLYAA